jgi:hypothetical protein
MQTSQAEIIRLADVKTEANPDIHSLRRLIAELEHGIEADEAAIAELDQQDAQNYRDGDSAQAQERMRNRMVLDATLRQKRNRLEGAKRDLEFREQVLVCQGVQQTHASVQAELNKARKLATEISKHLDAVGRGIAQLSRHSVAIVQSLRGVRGRSTMTDQGHIAGASISEILDVNHWRFYVDRHIAGVVPGYRTEFGSGPTFAEAACGNLDQINESINTLLGDHNFSEEVVAAAERVDQPAAKLED